MVRTQGILLIMWLALSSCHNIFAPILGDVDGGDLLYKMEMQSPADVLYNFHYAYSYRDSFIYAGLIDSDFVFLYFEPQDEGGSGHYASWGRDIELRTTGGLLRAFSYINLVWNSSLDSQYYRISDAGDVLQSSDTLFAESNSAEIHKGFQLSLGENIYIQGTARFEFVKNPHDGQWRLSEWRDESF